MVGGRQMLDPLDVGRPVDVGGILRTGDGEAALRLRARDIDQQAGERRLTVVAIGAQIAEVPALRHVERPIGVGVDRAIERARRG